MPPRPARTHRPDGGASRRKVRSMTTAMTTRTPPGYNRTPPREPKTVGGLVKNHLMQQEFSIPKLAAQLRTEADAYKLLEELRWGTDGPEACPKCGAADRQYFLAPADGTDTRKTRTGKPTERRI